MPQPAPERFKTPAAFRAWLRRHHKTATELLVCLHKTHVAHEGITYREALDEALCHGWIDGVRRRLDHDTFSIRFTPRKSRSIWSRVNVAHVERLVKAGRMTKAGRAVFAAREEARTGIYSFERAAMTLSPALAKRFRSNHSAWAHFQSEPPWYRRTCVFWVMSAKRDDTRLRRLDQLMLWAGKSTRIPALRRS